MFPYPVVPSPYGAVFVEERVEWTHKNRPAPNPARNNRNPPAPNAARNNRNPPAHNAARGNRNPPAHNPAPNLARGIRNPPAPNPAPNPARGHRNPPAHNPAPNPARGIRRLPAHNPARPNGVSPMADIARKLNLYADEGIYLYFAYGSNIHVSQMAERCPRSLFVGAASLPGHRWQINERGVANIVPSPSHRVEGLVYLVDREDEKTLDRSEGVSQKLYERQMREVDLTPHPTLYTQKSSLVAAELERNNAGVLRRGGPSRPELRPGRIKVLVYVSERFKTDGAIRTEYITRMQKAMADGLKLGISASYVEDCINPLINPRPRGPAHMRIEPRRPGPR
ncbi:Gamma-glutamylcyclotransferase [Beauveria bassiana]|nr:Gamma-glutamylcyclotransferase [Beauveria bassiana]